MTDDIDHAKLFDEFPELTDPNTILSKEVLAHFGLVFSAYADLEAALQLCFQFSNLERDLKSHLISNQNDWTKRYDHYEKKAFSATFGNLLKLTCEMEELKGLQPELRELKKIRDYFAHHFFREENSKLHSSEATIALLASMNSLRTRILAAHAQCDSVQTAIFGRLYPNATEKLQEHIDATKEDYRKNPSKSVGWE